MSADVSACPIDPFGRPRGRRPCWCGHRVYCLFVV